MSEHSGGHVRSEQSGASKRVSGATVLQYYSLYSWLLSSIVERSKQAEQAEQASGVKASKQVEWRQAERASRAEASE